MKLSNYSIIAAIMWMANLFPVVSFAQQPDLQFYRPNNKLGLNVFETSKADTVPYDGLKVRVGGDFAMQFQGIQQSNEADNLVDLGYNFNLPTANLNLDVQLLNGMRLHLRTYLSARHHNEAWIKGGHIQIDRLDFIREGFLSGIMDHTTITIGLDEFNYGDVHFRRTDNARAIFNPFVGNYIMDAFSTEAFGEITVQHSGFILVAGLTNGMLNQTTRVTDATDNQPSVYGKLGYDRQLTDDFRFRLTGSVYTNQGTTSGTWLYGGDRGGSRYYNVLHTVPNDEGVSEGGDFDGRYNARFTKLTAFQINPFIKFHGLEFFGVYEMAMGGNTFEQEVVTDEGTVIVEDSEGAFTQLGAELLYRIGRNESFYIGGRYNSVFGKMRESHENELMINRINLGGGWFLTRNVLVKAEYVLQTYEGDGWTGRFDGAGFSGVVIEAAISF